MAGIKINDLPALGRDLASTDLFEMSLAGGTGSRKITGQEIINGIPLPPSGITIGTTAITSGTNGRFLFDDAGVVSETNGAFWDKVNSRWGIGTITPQSKIDIRRTNATIQFDEFTTNSATGCLWFSSTKTTSTFSIAGEGTNTLINAPTGYVGFFQALAEKARFASGTGNFLINTNTDAGYKLDVNGTARVSGNVTVSGNTTITNSFIANSAGTGYEGFKIQDGGTARFVAERLVTNFLGIGHNSSAGRWDDVILGASQRLYFYTGASERARFAVTTGNFLIGTTTDAGYKLDVNGIARVATRIDAGTFTPGAGATAYTIATTGRISAGNGISFRTPVVGDSDFTGFVGGGIGIQIYQNNARFFEFGGAGGGLSPLALAIPGFNPSSGTGDKSIFQVSGVYQTSGTYSGAIRGFYYNPTLTSMTGVTAHWAIHTTSGRVRFEGLPTSPTGLNAGDLYNNLGVLMIV